MNQEGCLSVPGIYDNVERAESVTVTALDRNGARFTLNASGALATCIQHEMDHLHGKVFVELPLRPQAEPHPREAQETPAQGRLSWVPRPCASSSRAPHRSPPARWRRLPRPVSRFPSYLTQPDRPAGRGLRAHHERGRPGGRGPLARHRQARHAQGARIPRGCARRASRRDGGGRLWADPSRRRCSKYPRAAASTSTPRCCRAGAVRRPSSARFSRAMRDHGRLHHAHGRRPRYRARPARARDPDLGTRNDRLPDRDSSPRSGRGDRRSALPDRFAGRHGAGREPGHLCGQDRQVRSADRLVPQRRGNRPGVRAFNPIAGRRSRAGRRAGQDLEAEPVPGAQERPGAVLQACGRTDWWWLAGRGRCASGGCKSPAGARGSRQPNFCGAIRLTKGPFSHSLIAKSVSH